MAYILGILLCSDVLGGAIDRDAIVIPVVFHIIHMDGDENISNAQIADALRILNEDFNKENPDWPTVRPEFIDLVADVGIEFKLARRDPDGNCTNGITRTQSALTYNATDLVKSVIQWPQDRYLNIWVTHGLDSPISEISTSPAIADDQPLLDGIVIRQNYLGSIGTGSLAVHRTLTCAVGKWLGLLNTWGTGAPSQPTNCDQDDGIADTPNTIGHDWCDLDAATCGSPLDNVENFMEVSYCQKMFTEGQKARMLETLNSNIAQRDQLWTASNLSLTGVFEGPVLCSVGFVPASRTICAGETVVFTDISSGPVSQREWSFPGGTPASSADSIATVTYAAPGTHAVTLTVAEGSTELTTTIQAAVIVLSLPGSTAPFLESFESLDPISDQNWTLTDPYGSEGFIITDTAAFTGSRSITVRDPEEMLGQVAELISAPIDLSDASSIRIAYRYAYAQRDPANNDKLLVYVSQDCGANWSLRQELHSTGELNTAGISQDHFIPEGSQWAYTEIVDIPFPFLQEDLRVKFQFQSDGGNSMYIDDININGSPVGIADGSISAIGIRLFPNPATFQVDLELDLPEAQHVKIQLIDVEGRTISTIHEGTARNRHRTTIPIHQLSVGVYIVRCITKNGTLNTRLIVQ